MKKEITRFYKEAAQMIEKVRTRDEQDKLIGKLYIKATEFLNGTDDIELADYNDKLLSRTLKKLEARMMQIEMDPGF